MTEANFPASPDPDTMEDDDMAEAETSAEAGDSSSKMTLTSITEALGLSQVDAEEEPSGETGEVRAPRLPPKKQAIADAANAGSSKSEPRRSSRGRILKPLKTDNYATIGTDDSDLEEVVEEISDEEGVDEFAPGKEEDDDDIPAEKKKKRRVTKKQVAMNKKKALPALVKLVKIALKKKAKKEEEEKMAKHKIKMAKKVAMKKVALRLAKEAKAVNKVRKADQTQVPVTFDPEKLALLKSLILQKKQEVMNEKAGAAAAAAAPKPIEAQGPIISSAPLDNIPVATASTSGGAVAVPAPSLEVTDPNLLPEATVASGDEESLDARLLALTRLLLGKKKKKPGERRGRGRPRKPEKEKRVRVRPRKAFVSRSEDDIDEPSDCKLCGAQFQKLRALGIHISEVHVKPNIPSMENQENADGTVAIPYSSPVNGNQKRQYRCTTCNERFKYTFTFAHHRMSKHNEKTFIDNVEIMPAANFGRLADGKEHRCQECNRNFTCVFNLQRHVETMHIHPSQLKYRCDMCEDRIFSLQKFVYHRRKHTGNLPYACDFCEKRFIRMDKLKSHVEIHSDVAQYECEFCGTHYKSMACLRSHKHSSHNTSLGPKKSRAPSIRPKPALAVTASATHATRSHTAAQKAITAPARPRAPRRQRKTQTQEAAEAILNLDQFMADSSEEPTHEQPAHVTIQVPMGHELYQPIATYHQLPSCSYQTTGQVQYVVNRIHGGCKLCKQVFTDIRGHVMDFHKISADMLEAFLQSFSY